MGKWHIFPNKTGTRNAINCDKLKKQKISSVFIDDFMQDKIDNNVPIEIRNQIEKALNMLANEYPEFFDVGLNLERLSFMKNPPGKAIHGSASEEGEMIIYEEAMFCYHSEESTNFSIPRNGSEGTVFHELGHIIHYTRSKYIISKVKCLYNSPRKSVNKAYREWRKQGNIGFRNCFKKTISKYAAKTSKPYDAFAESFVAHLLAPERNKSAELVMNHFHKKGGKSNASKFSRTQIL